MWYQFVSWGQHYLVNMINKTLSDTDTPEVIAVLATFVDLKDAFPKQCPKLGIEVFQDRSITIKRHGKESTSQSTPGGGSQRENLGTLEYLAQSNQSADCVKDDLKHKFVNDFTVLEKTHLLMVGLASHNIKLQVPNDIQTNNQIIP